MALEALRLGLLLLVCWDSAGNAHLSACSAEDRPRSYREGVSLETAPARVRTALASLRAPVTGGSRPAPRLSRDTNLGVCGAGAVKPATLFSSCLGFVPSIFLVTLLSALSPLKQISWSPRSGVGFLCTRGPTEPQQEMYRNQEL